MHIKTPEEDGIVFPSTESTEVVVPINNIKQEIVDDGVNDDEDEEEGEDDDDGESDDDISEDSDESNLLESMLQPEVIIGSQ